jgi:TATA-box binding protein (TBP) (component of TFIID and TFIIIB)
MGRRMLTNIVCTSDLGYPIDLRDLTLTCESMRYDPKTCSAVIWQHPAVGGSCTVFKNGKICVNRKARTITEARKRVRRYARLVQKRGWPVVLRSIKIVSMSAYYHVEGTLSMDGLVRDMKANYDPELFAAALFKRGGIHFATGRFS